MTRRLVAGGAVLVLSSAIAAATTAGTTSVPDYVIAAAGDVCEAIPTKPQGGCVETATLVKNINPDYVVELGDMQYANNDPTTVANGYDAPGAWGDFKSKTFPVIGNHEIKNIPDTAWCSYWGAKAGCPTHQYRQDFGSWSLIALDTNGVITTAKTQQFRDLLAAAGTDNVIVAWHHPQFSPACRGCHGPTTKVKKFMDIAVASGVDVVLTAHDHLVANFDPMSGSGPAADGIPVFLVGTGGAHPDEGCDNRPPGLRWCAGGESRGLTGTQNDVSARAFTGVEVLSLGDTWFSAEFRHADGTATGASYDQVQFDVRP